ncbi:MAG: hypothetical protein M1274_14510 [Actinobacteria bacterium]|nr:hypothetical protein [Actinomycetota bacterium]
MATPRLKLGTMENAPDWYGKSLDELDFEWSTEEELELERYCEKIIKNAEEEEMTPLQRYDATWAGKEKDRLHFEMKYFGPVCARVLDSFADAVKPGDLYKRPKLHVKAHLAFAARYKIDIINVSPICYTEEFWGGNGRMIDYGTPQQVGGPPITKIEDIESCEVPDPTKHGLYPGLLWTVREIMRVMAKHGADKVLPIESNFCGDPLGTIASGMLGFGPALVAARKDLELFKACMEKATQWSIKWGNAVKTLQPNGMYMCTFMGAIPPNLKGNDLSFMPELNARIAKEIIASPGPTPPLWHTGGAEGWELWRDLYWEKGAVGPGSFGGWWIGPAMDPEWIYGFSAEKDLYCGCSIDDHIVLDGNWEAVEPALAARCKIAKQYPKHFIALGPLDYWTPPANIERLVELTKEAGRF